MLQGGVAFSRIGALLARLGVVRFCLARLSTGSTRFPRLVAQSFGREAAGVLGRLVGEVRKLPPEVWPWAQAHWSQSRCFAALADYLAALPESAVQAAAAGTLKALPIIVLSAGDASEERLAEHRALARLSPLGEHRIARFSGHWIQLDQPELVVRAVQDAIALVGT
jgi:pimeloyl-ACP methyl ester carboxylesterase